MTQVTSNKCEFQGIKNRRVEGEFNGGTISSEGGAILLRELCEKREYIKDFAKCFTDHRNPDLIEHSVETLLAQRVFGLCLGYEDINDQEEMRKDPLFSVLCGQEDILGERRHKESCKGVPLAGKSTLNRLELTPLDATSKSRYKKIVYSQEKIEAFFVQKFLTSFKEAPKVMVLDLDATDIPLFGRQEGRFYHGYYDCYCYLPLYIFCGDKLLAATLRQSNIDGSFGAIEEVERVVGQIRESFPDVAITIRGDSGFARSELMDWCEENDVYYILGLARNKRLVEEITTEMTQAKEEHMQTQKAARVFKDFRYITNDSWSTERRVVGKAEYLEKGENPRFIVTSIDKELISAKELYEKHYCARGEMENRIKEQQLGLFADRTSANSMHANQLRLWFSGLAYVIITDFKELALKNTQFENAQCETIRNKILKIGTRVQISARRIFLSFSSAFAYKSIFNNALQILRSLCPLST